MFKFKSKATYNGCLGITVISLFASILGALFTPKMIMVLIRRGLKDQISLKSSNVKKWGEIPGEYDLKVYRNVTFFNWTNVEAFEANGEKPRFQFVDSVILQELNQVTNIQEDTDNAQISFDLTYNLTGEYTSAMDQKITIPNLFAFGVWNTAKNLDVPTMAFTALGTLFANLMVDDLTYYQCLSIGVDQTFFNGELGKFEYAYKKYFENTGITQELAKDIWSDNIFGFSNNYTRKYWLQAVDRGFESPDSIRLMDYFGIESHEMISLFENLEKPLNGVKLALKNAYDCPGDECTSQYISLIQMASQNITLFPPIGPVFPSFTNTNTTTFGYIEISYFVKEIFYKKISDEEVYKKDCNFTLEQVSVLLNISKSRDGCAKSDRTLLHPTNIQFFMGVGFKYDKSKNIQDFKPFLDRFGLNNVYQARILFEYLKYIAVDFSTVGTNDPELAARANFFRQGMIQIWEFVVQNLKKVLLNNMAYQMAQDNDLSCIDSLKLSSPNAKQDELANFCGAEKFGKSAVQRLFNWCMNQTNTNFKRTFGEYEFKRISVSLFCWQDSNEGSFAAFYKKVQATLSQKYNCKRPESCNDHELTAMQWVNGTITQNPPESIEDIFPKSPSLSNWFPDYIPSPFEFSVIGKDLDKPSVDDAVLFLFWDNAFAIPVIVKAIGMGRSGDVSFLKKYIYQSDVKAFENYVNSFLIDVVFGGMTLTTTVKDLVEGYTSPIMTQVAEMNPLFGGDPSVDPTVSLVPRISTYPQTRNTGAKDIKKVDKFVKLNGLPYINKEMPYFDGNKSSTYKMNPWKEEDTLQGSDNIYESFLTKDSEPAAYITDIFRYGATQYTKTIKHEKSGLESYRFQIKDSVTANSYDNPDNEKYYMSVYNAAFNLTSVQQAPVFVSKLYMHQMNSSVVEKIDMVDKKGKALEFKNDTDELFLEIQKITGVPTRINLDLQTNVEIPYDTLFTKNEHMVLPVFVLRREMDQLSDDQMTHVFGDVIKALNSQIYIRVVFVLLSLAFLGITFAVLMKNRRLAVKDEIDENDLNEPILNDDMATTTFKDTVNTDKFLSGTDTAFGSKILSKATMQSEEDGL